MPPRRINRISDRQHTPVTRRCWTLFVALSSRLAIVTAISVNNAPADRAH
jgi:hypothetical protein